MREKSEKPFDFRFNCVAFIAVGLESFQLEDSFKNLSSNSLFKIYILWLPKKFLFNTLQSFIY